MHIPFRKTSKKDCLKEVEADVRLGQKPPLLEVMPACLWTDKPSNAACLWTFHYITIHLLVDITLHYNTHACEHYITIHLLVNNREPLSKLNALYSSPRLHASCFTDCLWTDIPSNAHVAAEALHSTNATAFSCKIFCIVLHSSAKCCCSAKVHGCRLQ